MRTKWFSLFVFFFFFPILFWGRIIFLVRVGKRRIVSAGNDVNYASAVVIAHTHSYSHHLASPAAADVIFFFFFQFFSYCIFGLCFFLFVCGYSTGLPHVLHKRPNGIESARLLKLVSSVRPTDFSVDQRVNVFRFSSVFLCSNDLISQHRLTWPSTIFFFFIWVIIWTSNCSSVPFCLFSIFFSIRLSFFFSSFLLSFRITFL